MGSSLSHCMENNQQHNEHEEETESKHAAHAFHHVPPHFPHGHDVVPPHHWPHLPAAIHLLSRRIHVPCGETQSLSPTTPTVVQQKKTSPTKSVGVGEAEAKATTTAVDENSRSSQEPAQQLRPPQKQQPQQQQPPSSPELTASEAATATATATTTDNHPTTKATTAPKHHYSSSFFHGFRNKTGHWVQAVEDFFFPRFLLVHHHSHSANDLVPPHQQSAAAASVRGGVLLEGCTTAAEHKAAVQHALEVVHGVSSAPGLAALGLAYRLEPCLAHSQVTTTTTMARTTTMLASTDVSVLSHASNMSYDDNNDNDDDTDHNFMIESDRTSEVFEIGQEHLVPVCFSDDDPLPLDNNSLAKDPQKNHHDEDEDDDDKKNGEDASELSSSPTSTLAPPPPQQAHPTTATATATATASITAPTITPSTSDQDILSTYNTVGGTVGASTCRFGPMEDGKLPIPPHRPLPRTASTETLHDLAVDIPYDYLPSLDEERAKCPMCMRRLYHVPTNTLITEENRKRFIADGDMYEEVARLCQEYAHEIMCEEGGLEWVLIEPSLSSSCSSRPDDEQPATSTTTATATADHSATATPEREPIRAMVNSDHPCLLQQQQSKQSNTDLSDRPTLFIATGRGKVRAGIFSRQHLITSGLESATAVPVVREAKVRRLNIVIVDPNVHGERLGYVTFSKTMDYTLSQLSKTATNSALSETTNPEGNAIESSSAAAAAAAAATTKSSAPLQARDLYVLSHSASGGHLARYLLDKSDEYLPHIRAIAFTDSTHNIQWARTHNKDQLYDFLESDKCVYFRCSNIRQEHNTQWYLHRAGEEVQTDTFWKNRFGKVKTYWAGTNEHSMTNWYAHHKIWEHFDHHLQGAA